MSTASRRLPTLLGVTLVASLAACQAHTRGAALQAAYLHPMLAAAEPALEEGEGSGGAAAGRGAGAGGGAGAAAVPSGTTVPAAATVPSAATLPAADEDPRRAGVVESARRLVGVQKSFDDRSFLGHVLRINALLPPGAVPAAYATDDYLRAAKSAGRVIALEASRPGDVVLFACDEGCGESATGGMAAGVVERVGDARVEWIGYDRSIVRRCWTGAGRDPGPGFARVEKVFAVVSLGR